MIDPILQDVAGQLTTATKQLADLTTAVNIGWTLLTGFLVMFMQAGFALVETGLPEASARGLDVIPTALPEVASS